MERYLWSMNGKTISPDDTILIKKGENVRFVMKNKTMMRHPMHLHGHFFRVVTPQGEYSVLKHTVDVAPMETVTIEFAANEEKDWFFHCHILYHMDAGMERVIHYEDTSVSEEVLAVRDKIYDRPWTAWAESGVSSQRRGYWLYTAFVTGDYPGCGREKCAGFTLFYAGIFLQPRKNIYQPMM